MAAALATLLHHSARKLEKKGLTKAIIVEEANATLAAEPTLTAMGAAAWASTHSEQQQLIASVQ